MRAQNIGGSTSAAITSKCAVNPMPMDGGENITSGFLGRAYRKGKRMTRKPDVTIGPDDNPYMLRWFLIPRNPFFNIYRHHILRGDDDRALHDHRSWNISIVTSGGYWEFQPINPKTYARDLAAGHRDLHKGIFRQPGSIVFRRAATPHRLELRHEWWSLESKGPTIPAKTIFIKGPDFREWGFWCERGWKRWQDFLGGEYGKFGPGCD